MFNDTSNLNNLIQKSVIIDDLFSYDINIFQNIFSYPSKCQLPEIKEGKILAEDNSKSQQFKIKNDNNLEFKENKIDEFNKKEYLSLNDKKKNDSGNILEKLKAGFLNEKKFSRKKLGKKREFVKHTKFADDNLQRKCITIIMNNILEFINKRIKKIYNGNIGNGMNCKKLLSVQLKSNFYTIDYIKNLLHKTLGEIYSDNISIKYSNYLSDYNILLIKKLLNEEDKDKRIYLEKLFGITFLQCAKKFAGIYSCEELDGFTTFNEYKNKLNQDSEYLDALKNYLINFEENIRRKKPKEKNKNKVNP